VIYEGLDSPDGLDRHTTKPHGKHLGQDVRDLLECAFEVSVLDSLGQFWRNPEKNPYRQE
jgi:hypothetical protein